MKKIYMYIQMVDKELGIYGDQTRRVGGTSLIKYWFVVHVFARWVNKDYVIWNHAGTSQNKSTSNDKNKVTKWHVL